MITETFNTLRRALKVVALDPELHSLLGERDPKALAQIKEAVELSDQMAPAIVAQEELLVAMLKHRADDRRIQEMIEKINWD
jgi:hypothetical protein